MQPMMIAAEDLLLRTVCGELKDHPAIWVTKDAIVITIVHFAQQAAQHLGMSMDIANEIVLACDHELLSLWLRQSWSQRPLA